MFLFIFISILIIILLKIAIKPSVLPNIVIDHYMIILSCKNIFLTLLTGEFKWSTSLEHKSKLIGLDSYLEGRSLFYFFPKNFFQNSMVV